MYKAFVVEHSERSGDRFYTVGVRGRGYYSDRFILRSWRTRCTAARKASTLQEDLDDGLVIPGRLR